MKGLREGLGVECRFSDYCEPSVSVVFLERWRSLAWVDLGSLVPGRGYP
jgi:hypothetical protein